MDSAFPACEDYFMITANTGGTVIFCFMPDTSI